STGFTMAEILLSLTIIGVVAAITLPSLTGNINERTWNTQRKALYARMSQAIALMPALNGYGTIDETTSTDTAAETFVTGGLAKVLKINNICASGSLKDCGIPENINTLANGQISFPQDWNELNPKMLDASYANSSAGVALSNELINAKAAAFETANGESIAVYYQPNCVADMNEGSVYMIQPKICANLIYDLNGTKGPNTVGKDIGFMSILYPTDGIVVAPVPVVGGMTTGDYQTLLKKCRSYDDARLPIKEELASMFVNKKLLNDDINNYVSATTPSTNVNSVYHLFFTEGVYAATPKSATSNRGWCVKRN
ncbi:MAG: type II secretion system GspH family protein, partial [Fusobacterium sp.]|nr:type II secretion system GspH family protein [Fusobacterium sp.]